jgi:DNA-binding GntR family transcriptional regulator
MNQSDVGPFTRATMVEHVYQRLRSAIWHGELAPGEKLVIDRLARSFEVSITPVREALRRLQLEGLVTDLPYKGVHVAEANAAELRELFTVRGVLEGFAIAQGLSNFTPELMDELQSMLDGLQVAADAQDVPAFKKLNVAFHDRILEVAATGKLRAMVFDLARNTERYRLLDIQLGPGYVQESQAQHRRLLELLRAGASSEIEELSRAHALMYADHLERSAGTSR